ncbi:MAG: PP2C family protein-serine/threonine phosphatase [Candidatus Binatia bacterium]
MEEGAIKVLLIEDNPGDARLMSEMLSEARGVFFELECAERLSTGLERLDTGDIALVLLDLSLPDSQGLETFSRVYARAPRLPIVVLTGLDDEALAVQTVHEGGQDYLVKGQVDGHSLVRAMRYAIERKRTQEQLSSYARELRERNEQLEQDLRMARELQLAMLPHRFPSIPPGAPLEESAVKFFSFYRPRGAVSGDLFDVIPLSDTAVGVFISDVMGHDVRAALVTAMMRALLEKLGPVAADPGRLLTEANRGLARILKPMGVTMYATAFYLVADVAEGSIRFANAGHPSPLHLHLPGGSVESVGAEDKAGPAMGLFEDPVYPTCQRLIVAGDCLMLFTDGLFEVEGPNHEPYGRDRLWAEVSRRSQLPPADLFAGLLDDVKEFSEHKEFTDDVCLLGMEVTRLC